METDKNIQDPPRVRIAALCALAFVAAIIGGAGATAPSGTRTYKGPVRLIIRTDPAAPIRSGGGAATLRVRVRCSQDSVGEVDAILEQSSTRTRAVRGIAMACGPQDQYINLVFEQHGHRFTRGVAVLRLDASAGFGEQFGLVHVGPALITLR